MGKKENVSEQEMMQGSQISAEAALSSQDDVKELFNALLKHSKKQVFYARIAAFCACLAVAAMIACLLIIVPAVMKTVKNANDIMEQASNTITIADTAIESVTEMSGSITAMGDDMDAFVMDNAQSVQEIMKKLDEIDFVGLNKAIRDLGDVVEPLANFFGKFK